MKVKLVESDSKLIEDKITSLSNKINTIHQSLVWTYFNGDIPTKQAVINELENIHNITLSKKDIDIFLAF